MQQFIGYIQRWRVKISLLLAAGLALLLLSGCSDTAPSILDPKGPAARSISNLGWLFIILGSVIFVLVMAYLLYAVIRIRPDLRRPRAGTMVVIVAGMIIPGIILLVLFVFNTNVLGEVTAPDDDEVALSIEVNGNQWWWEITYPDQGFETANEIHIPVGQPVRLQLTSDNVIHSFWVPELHGKMDLIPGRTNHFWIEADEPGEYMGLCAEYCGTQHAKMLFVVVAEPEEQFNQWLAGQQLPAAGAQAGAVADGQALFMQSNCVQCHTVAGTDAAGELGPDLTHLASRRTLGAGAVPLTRENLLAWVADPHIFKPGVLMPPSDFSGEELNLLVDYLLSLE